METTIFHSKKSIIDSVLRGIILKIFPGEISQNDYDDYMQTGWLTLLEIQGKRHDHIKDLHGYCHVAIRRAVIREARKNSEVTDVCPDPAAAKSLFSINRVDVYSDIYLSGIFDQTELAIIRSKTEARVLSVKISKSTIRRRMHLIRTKLKRCGYESKTKNIIHR